MKKKVISVICVLLVMVLLIPIPTALKDGVTVIYNAILYQVKTVHSFADTSIDKDNDKDGYTEGTIVKIFGIEVYNDVE